MVNEVLDYSPQLEMLRVPLIVIINNHLAVKMISKLFSPVST